MVKSHGRTYILDASQIEWCEAQGNYVQLHVNQECYRVRTTIARVEAAMPQYDIIRIHRSTLVNLARVHRVHPTDNTS
jgi:two-component system LytT family response regulator